MPWWWPFQKPKNSKHRTSQLSNKAQALISQLKNPDQYEDIVSYISHINHILTHVSRKKHPLLWAALQVALGDGMTMSQSGDRQTQLMQALVHYKQALSEYHREHSPLEWAQIQYNK